MSDPMPDPKRYHLRLPPYRGPRLPEPPHAWYPGVRSHHAACTSDRLLRGDGTIRAFVVHATAGPTSAGAMSVMLAHRASWHWLIPDEDEPEHGRLVWACAPESRAAWHVRNDRSHPDVNGGRRDVNYWSLGLEVVNAQKADAFSRWQVEQTAALVRYAWSKYPGLVDVVSHAKLDPARRDDPGAAFPWDELCELVLAPSAPVFVDLSRPPAPTATPPAVAAAPRIRVLGPGGAPVECDARLLDGVTVVEARPLIEALGFAVAYDDGPPMTIAIRPAAVDAPPTGG